MGCILKGPILFPFIDCKCNERKVINIISFCYENDKLPPLRFHTHRIYLLLLESETSGKFRVIRSIRHQKEINRSLEEVSMRFRKRICGKKAWSFQEKGFSTSSKQCMLRLDVSYNQSELFHFCMLTSIIGKKVRRTKPKYNYLH